MRVISSRRSSSERSGNGGVRPLPGDPFHHPVVPVAAAGDLRQMGDAEDLMVPGDLPEFLADDLRRRAADPAVHLVEDDRPHRTGPGQDLLQGQHDPGELPAGGDPPKRLQLLAHVRREIKLQVVRSLFR